MNGTAKPLQVVRFGAFEVDLRAGVLRKHGIRLKLQDQPFQILALLLERRGEVVTREELRARLWPSDTFVDFDHGLNSAINKLREALGDSAENPRYIETLPRRGYRFVGELATEGPGVPSAAELTQGAPQAGAQPVQVLEAAPWPRRRWLVPGAVLGLIVLLAAGIYTFNLGGVRDRMEGKALASPIQSIAVLPLVNLSDKPEEEEYFADGMTAELIAELAQVSSLRVISRTSVMQYKNVKKPLPQIARELGVDAVVEGAILRSGNRVRITAELLDARTDRHLWAQGYERDLRDVLALQSDVARAIVKEVQAKLTPQESTRLARTTAVDPEVYKLYLQGVYYGGRAQSPRAVESYLQALAKDPNYAPAYAGLAEAYAYTLPANVYMPKARESALRALELDENLGDAHVALAQVKFFYDWDWAAAEKAYRRGLELNPSSAIAHNRYSMFLTARGRFDEAIAEAGRARELDPLSLLIATDVGRVFYFTRRYDQAIAEYHKAIALDPQYAQAHFFLSFALEQKQQYADAIGELAKTRELAGDKELAAGIREGYEKGGYRSALRAWASAWERPAERGSVQPTSVAFIYARAGEKDKAFEYLEKGFRIHTRALVYLKVEPQLDNVRDDPRFDELVRRVGLDH